MFLKLYILRTEYIFDRTDSQDSELIGMLKWYGLKLDFF